MGSNKNHDWAHKIKLLYTKFNAKKSWTLKNLMGKRCQTLKRTIFQLERECTSCRTIGIRFEFILTTAQWITVLSVAKLLYQLLFKLSEIPVEMVRVVCWLESRIYKYSPCLKTDVCTNPRRIGSRYPVGQLIWICVV